MKRIAVFASGNGTNAEAIVQYFAKSNQARVIAIFCNKPDAFVLKRAEKLALPAFVFNRADFIDPNGVLKQLQDLQVDWIVLAGFLWLVPQHLIAAYPQRIINIHPALLPKYGGKGMFGNRVHEAIIESGDSESGITIHYVNEHFDEGEIIFQAKCAITSGDTAESLAEKIHQLEHEYFPMTVAGLINQ
jgi:phosphoribosylglycinamide formyltransferase-1